MKLVILIITCLLGSLTPAISQDPPMAMSSKSIWLRNGNSKFLGPNKDDYATMSNVEYGYVFVGDGSALQNGKSYKIQTGGKFLYCSFEGWARFNASATNETFSWIIEKQKEKCPPSSKDDFIRHGDVILLRNAYYPKSYLYDNEAGDIYAAAGDYPAKPREWIVDWKLTEVPRTQMPAESESNSIAPVTSDNFDVIIISGKNKFTQIWDDKGSEAEADVSIWRPIVPSGYFSLGDVVLSAHMADDRDTKLYTLAIRPKQGKEGLLIKPSGVTEVWNDAGSGADKGIRISKLNCPAGFNALGVIGNNLPNECRCVKDSETAKGSWGSTSQKEQLVAYWTDKGSGSNEDVSFWRVSAVAINGKNQMALSPNTFFASDDYKVPTGLPYALRLVFSNVDIFNKKDVDEPDMPKFTSDGKLPKDFSSTTIEYFLPFFLVREDANYRNSSQIEQMEKDPEYKVTRTSTYIINTQSTLASNAATLSSQKTSGTSSSTEHSFATGITRGISVAVGVEGSIGVATASVEVTSSLEASFSYSWGGSEGTYDEKADSYTITIDPNCQGAIFQRIDNYVIQNLKGDEILSYSSNIPTFGSDMWCKGKNNTTAVTNPATYEGKDAEIKYPISMKPGDYLLENEILMSANGRFQLRVTLDGNFIIEKLQSSGNNPMEIYRFPLPNSGGEKPTISFLRYGTDGNVCVVSDQGKWYCVTNGNDATANILNKSVKLELTNDGRLILVNSNREEIWGNIPKQ